MTLWSRETNEGANLTPGLKASISSVAIALAVTAVGAVGTAYADTPAGSGAAAAVQQAPPPARPAAPHRFRSKFKTLQQCQAIATHDHPGRRGDWDCRRGPDRINSWEYWAK